MTEKVFHTLSPVFDAESNILILGSIPSPRSRQIGFYYGHPQNRFWKVMFALYGEPFAETTEERVAFLKRHRIALWDVLASCDIRGASDASIRDPVPNDIASLLAESSIRRIFTTGTTAYKYYEKLCFPETQIHASLLPSPSPANAACRFDDLLAAYSVILKG